MIVTLEEDPDTGDLLLPLDINTCTALRWKEGDILEWFVGLDGYIHITKIEEVESDER